MAKYSPLAKEIKSSLGLEYKDQDIIGKRFIWYVYMKRGELVFHEKRKRFRPYLSQHRT